MDWTPVTRLGRLVQGGQITTFSEVLASRMPIREVEIIDAFFPDLADEVLDVKMVQRMTDSGRRPRFAVTVCVGNADGFVGMGRAKGKEVGPTIRKAIRNAKLGIIEVRRGCGTWECGCRKPHTIPFQVEGRCGSVRVSLKPAPRGVGLAAAGVVRYILTLAGVEDVWSFSRGHTKTTVNYAYAAFNALRMTGHIPIHPKREKELMILSGPRPVGPPPMDEVSEEDVPAPDEETEPRSVEEGGVDTS